LSRIFNHNVAGKASTNGETLTLRITGQEQPAERHAQVSGFRDLEKRQHALAFAGGSFAALRMAAAGLRRRAKRRHFFSQSKQARLAGRKQEAETVAAAKPLRPLQTAMIDGGFKTVANQGLSNQMGQTFHGAPQFRLGTRTPALATRRLAQT
jgi:hypothetical protein